MGELRGIVGEERRGEERRGEERRGKETDRCPLTSGAVHHLFYGYSHMIDS
jgi:hypothetical protein